MKLFDGLMNSITDDKMQRTLVYLLKQASKTGEKFAYNIGYEQAMDDLNADVPWKEDADLSDQHAAVVQHTHRFPLQGEVKNDG